jgi:hypothetical protein
MTQSVQTITKNPTSKLRSTTQAVSDGKVARGAAKRYRPPTGGRISTWITASLPASYINSPLATGNVSAQ